MRVSTILLLATATFKAKGDSFAGVTESVPEGTTTANFRGVLASTIVAISRHELLTQRRLAALGHSEKH